MNMIETCYIYREKQGNKRDKEPGSLEEIDTDRHNKSNALMKTIVINHGNQQEKNKT